MKKNAEREAMAHAFPCPWCRASIGFLCGRRYARPYPLSPPAHCAHGTRTNEGNPTDHHSAWPEVYPFVDANGCVIPVPTSPAAQAVKGLRLRDLAWPYHGRIAL